MPVVGCRHGASYRVGCAEQAARKAFRQYDVALLFKACGAVAVEQREVEHAEKRRVGMQHVCVDEAAALFQLDASCREAACLLYFGVMVAQVTQHSVVAVGRPPAVIAEVKADVIDTLGLAVLPVYAAFLPRVQPYYDDECQADGQSEDVYRRVCLVP